MCRIARRNIAIARSAMHQDLGPEAQRLSPNSVVLERLGLLEPSALAYFDKMMSRVGCFAGLPSVGAAGLFLCVCHTVCLD